MPSRLALASTIGGLLAVGFAALLFIQPLPDMERAPHLPDGQAATVTRVVDGDTVVVRADGEEFKVRLVGVDTPESVHPTKPIEPFGPEASEFTRRALGGDYNRVILVTDVIQGETDRYKRRLAYIVRQKDGADVGAELLEVGLAEVYSGRFDRKEFYKQLEDVAQRASVGMWASSFR